MELDLETIIINILFCLFVIIYTLLNPQKLKYSEIIRLLKVGFSILLFTTIINSIAEGKWGIDYIIDFLALKNVGEWLLRVLVSLSYILIIGGIVGLLVIKFRKKTRSL